jgi:hypothetical protein
MELQVLFITILIEARFFGATLSHCSSVDRFSSIFSKILYNITTSDHSSPYHIFL